MSVFVHIFDTSERRRWEGVSGGWVSPWQRRDTKCNQMQRQAEMRAS